MPNNLLLTGPPGCGKTTLIERVVAALPRGAAGGFVTHELRRDGRRVGFEVRTLDGRSAVLAHVELRSSQRVGRYGVDVSSFERTGVRALQDALAAGQVIVIDEIGSMELFSARFRRSVIEALDAPNPVIATIRLRPEPFCDALKRRPDVELWHVTLANRDVLPDQVVAWLNSHREISASSDGSS